MPKFFVNNNQIKNEIISIKGEDVNHIANVLRLQKQDKIFICDKDEQITYQTEIKDITREEVICKVIEKIMDTTESIVQVTIFQGLPKADKMEYIIQKATELGVKEIVPIATKRCVVKLEEKDEKKKIDRWQKISEMAAKQSGRNMIPKIENIIKIQKVEELIPNFNLFLVAYEEEKEMTLKQLLQELKEKVDSKKDIKADIKIGVVIGPEGGLERDEVKKLESKGAKVITLGNRILRTETASIAILSNIMYEMEY